MTMIRTLLWAILAGYIPHPLLAQSPSFNFHHLTTDGGLSNGVIRSFARDKFGYIWIGSVNGLTRFNGYDVKVFRHSPGDSSSLPDNNIPALFCDNNGRLWVATTKGISEYNYSKIRFRPQAGSMGLQVSKMMQAPGDMLYLATNHGLCLFDPLTKKFTGLAERTDSLSASLLAHYVVDFCSAGPLLYISTDTGLVVYNTILKQARRKVLPGIDNLRIGKIAIDKEEHLWVNYGEYGDSLLRADKDLSIRSLYGKFFVLGPNLKDDRINTVFPDDNGRVWITTSRLGLCLYDKTTDSFISYAHDPLQSMSISGNLTTQIFQDKEGTIWVGTEGYGINYFHPDKAFFHTIQASFNQSPTLPDNWCRVAAEDDRSFLWLGTSGGLAQYNPLTNTYRLFQNARNKENMIFYNSIRSLSCQGDTVWIGTGNGLNRYHISTGKMDFFSAKEGVPESFYWAILKDHTGYTWFGCRDGLYRYDPASGKIESLAGDALLDPWHSTNVRCLYEDKLGRIWIGFYSQGVLLYDPIQKKVKHWKRTDTEPATLSNNNINSITQDRNGVIWIATQEGLNFYDPVTGNTKPYTQEKELSSGSLAALQTDDHNRLWLAGNTGLYMLDSARHSLRSFGVRDGLPSPDFNMQSAYRTHNGDFIYPTLNGFVLFNPLRYSETKDTVGVYVSSFKVFGKPLNDTTNFESMQSVRLAPSQNFFSLEMTALNYLNPEQSWYAYKLEPFDKDWIYTRERAVNYTNVPGGDYTFHYKASADNSNWDLPEKTILIELGTIYYRTNWFKGLLFALICATMYLLYRRRLRQKERLHLLQTKAYSLEKEKAQVMYESLKQQLNPHFLFNSLTSLSSLISRNPTVAKSFLDGMSRIYRYILKSRDSETVALSEELHLAEIYTQLQQTRFKEGLQVKIDVEEESQHRKIAPVTLQNLIENAIKHNIIDKDAPLVINIYTEKDYLIVQNNLQKKTFVETSNRQGLTNMQSLYHYLSEMPMLIIEDNNYFTVKIPLI